MTGQSVAKQEFAAQYDRTAEDWIVFPADHAYRKQLFCQGWTEEAVKELMGHPARANVYMIEEIVKYVSQPGQRVMDIMAGSGTIMVAALIGRDVVCLELEQKYSDMQHSVLATLPQPHGTVVLVSGDCRKLLPLPADHIVFSPPYANILHRDYKAGKMTVADKDLSGPYSEGLPSYSDTPGNLTLLNRFLYNQEMEKIYALCFQSLPHGGTLTIILKDYTERGKRVYLTDWMVKCCVRAGFRIREIFKRYSPGTGYLQLWRSKGLYVVTDEDIAIMEKP